MSFVDTNSIEALPSSSGHVDVIIDPWSGLDHKDVMRSNYAGIPDWVDRGNKRRLTAYMVIAGYLRNVSRLFLSKLSDDEERQKAWQEYGDPKVLLDRIAAGVIGEDPQIAVVGADTPIPDEPDLRPAPPQPTDEQLSAMPEGERTLRRRIAERALQLWLTTSQTIVDRWEALIENQPGLIARQDWLRQWATDAGFLPLMVENETDNVVGMGSGIYVLGWDSDRERPQVEIYEPSAYFPILDDARPSEFPNRVHLAWGTVENEGTSTEKRFVRRITYELVDLRDPVVEAMIDFDRAGYLEEGEEQTHVCLLSDLTIPVDAFRDKSLNDVAEQAGIPRSITVDGEPVALRRYPIGYDFLPVVHVTHNLASQHHFGESPIVSLAMLFDELQASDTDESMSSRWAARPPAGVSGMAQSFGATEAERQRNNTIDVRAGKWFKLADGGKVDVIELAANLTAIGERIKELLKRLSVNGQVPEGLIGRVNAAEVPSGLALTLSFTSFEQMIEGARLARAGKYRLLLKMVQRIQIHHAGGFALDDTDAIILDREVMAADVAFGAFMPQDLPAAIELARNAVEGFISSQETAIAYLAENGYPVEDAAAELAAIRARMGQEAEHITQATGDVGAGAEFLGLPEIDDDDDGEGEGTDPQGTPVGPGVLAQ